LSTKSQIINLFRPDSDRFCLFSIKFSPTKQEILAGSSDRCIYIYDLEKKKVSSKVRAHCGDINTVCYASSICDQIFYSGGDDMYCKIWDRRTFGKYQNPEGVLIGHLEGITHIDSKGDGKHLITNSKDQSIKLWDIRKMQCGKVPLQQLNKCHWDYRYGEAAASPTLKKIFTGVLSHPSDMSLMTYRSHKVFRTLIRSYFSPAYTNQRYIYTGSTDGTCYGKFFSQTNHK
jgi:WD repeat-containing protein 23